MRRGLSPESARRGRKNEGATHAETVTKQRHVPEVIALGGNDVAQAGGDRGGR